MYNVFTITGLVSAFMLRKLPFVFVLVFLCIFFFKSSLCVECRGEPF